MAMVIETEVTPLRVDKHGTIRVGKTRVSLDLVIQAYNKGSSPEEIVTMYDALNLADVYFAVGYYLRHKAQVDEYIREGEEKADQIGEVLKERFGQAGIRERLEARQLSALSTKAS